MMLIQESKVKYYCIINTKRRMWKDANFQWQEFEGDFGGLITIWDPNTMKPINIIYQNQSNRYIHTSIINVEYNFEFIITNLCAPNDIIE